MNKPFNKTALTFLISISCSIAFGQTNCPEFIQENQDTLGYLDCIKTYRKNAKNEFITDVKSPIKKKDIDYLDYYQPIAEWLLLGKYKLTPEEKPIEFTTSSGTKRQYRQYAIIYFQKEDCSFELAVYESESLKANPEYADYIFLPFTDLSNEEETYGGGRYMELKTGDFKNNQVLVDFNKTYNPYCAYSEGYNCPIPPEKNRLKIKIEAGEKNFKKPH
ncbi:MAG: DUF1684 domain-containing protein [Bacteroidia bacterium]